MANERNLQNWVKKIADESFIESFKENPTETLHRRGFLLHPSYATLLDELGTDERAAIATPFVNVANAQSADELRSLYEEWADQYESFFGWATLDEEGPRGWF